MMPDAQFQVPKVQTAQPGFVAEWLTLIDGIAGANLQNDALLTFLFVSTCLDILWIGDG